MPARPLSDAECVTALRHIRARMVASYRKNGPEVGPVAYVVHTSVRDAGYEPHHQVQLTEALWDAGVLRVTPTGLFTLTDSFRYHAVRDAVEDTWVYRREPAAGAAKWRVAGHRRHLSSIATGAAETDPAFAVLMAATAVCGSLAQGHRVAAGVGADPASARLLISLADGDPMSVEATLTVVHAIALPAAS